MPSLEFLMQWGYSVVFFFVFFSDFVLSTTAIKFDLGLSINHAQYKFVLSLLNESEIKE